MNFENPYCKQTVKLYECIEKKGRDSMKKTLKAITASALALSMTLAMVGCGSKEAAPAATKAAAETETKAEGGDSASSGDWKFDRRVEIMVPASEGGGLDTTIRAFAPYLEKEIGNSIVINNRGGGSGITGYTWSHNSTNDGYAFQFTAPSAILADAQGLCDFELMDELIPVSGLVSAEGIIFGGKKAPFQTAEEMVEYCKAHPGEVSIATDSPNGISGALITEFCEQAGIELKWITSESNEANISLIAGEVDLYIGTWSDAGAYVESGDINALVVLSENRNENFPDVTCAGDLGYNAQLSFYRVFTAMGDTPQEAIDAFAAAVKTASQDPEWEAWLATNGMVNDYVYTAEELDEVLKVSHEFGAKLAGK